QELSAGEIAAHFDVSRPAVSQHLTVLKEAGLVDERRNGTRRLYRARPEGLAELKAFLEEFWGDRLEALKREAERGEKETRGADAGAGHHRARARDRREPGEGRGLPRRPREGGALDGRVGPVRSAAGRRVSGPGHPGAHGERRVRRARPAAPPRLHLGL